MTRKPQELKTHCKWGHELSGDNVRIYARGSTTWRVCRTCKREHMRSVRISWGNVKRRPAERTPEITAGNPLYRAELAAYLERRRAKLAAVHDEVQRRIAFPFTWREMTGQMIR